jgi:hypothetical protein
MKAVNLFGFSIAKREGRICEKDNVGGNGNGSFRSSYGFCGR